VSVVRLARGIEATTLTCIAGVVHNGKVTIGGDSAGVCPKTGALQLRKDSKVFKNGEYLIGVAGSWRVMQVIRFANLPGYRHGHMASNLPPMEPFEWTVRMFLPTLRKMNLPETDFELLVGFRGHLFHIYGTEQVSEEIASYEACGSGAQVARGALHVARDQYSSALGQVKVALDAAERFCSGVRGPFTILSI
jgi:ATP-dependent protease HslVU (ClpYQ) peptidase subunit